MVDATDDDGVIATLPDLQIEVSHSEDMLILQQTDHSGGVDRIAIHRWQVRMLAEEMGLLPTPSHGEVEAVRRAAMLARRLRLLHARIAQMDEWLSKQPDFESADITLEVSFSEGTMALADEFLAEMSDVAAPVQRDAPARSTAPRPAAARAPLAHAAPKRRLGVVVQAGEHPEQVAHEAFRDFVVQNKPLLMLVAHWGDDRCGWLLQILLEELLGAPRLGTAATAPVASAPGLDEKQGGAGLT